MDAAWELGITHFDTADAYGGGRSERAIGRWIAARGVRPTLTTKTFNPMERGSRPGSRRSGSAAAHGEPRAARASTGSSCTSRTSSTRRCRWRTTSTEAFEAHQRARPDRRVRGQQLRRRAADAGARRRRTGRRVQNGTRCCERGDEAELLPLCARARRRVLASQPARAAGWLTGKYRRGEPYPAGSRMTQRPEPYAAARRRARRSPRSTRCAQFADARGGLDGGRGARVAARRTSASRRSSIGPGRPEQLRAGARGARASARRGRARHAGRCSTERVLVLSHDDVHRRARRPEACERAMAEVLIAQAPGRRTSPLRNVVTPPGRRGIHRADAGVARPATRRRRSH